MGQQAEGAGRLRRQVRPTELSRSEVPVVRGAACELMPWDGPPEPCVPLHMSVLCACEHVSHHP